MRTRILGWTTLAEEPLVLSRIQELDEGEPSSSLAVRLPSGKLMLISPPEDLSPQERDALRSHCGVEALVSIHGLHDLGLAPCHSAFPQAVIYACAGVDTYAREQHEVPARIEPIEALARSLGDKIKVIAMEHDEIGDVLVRIQTEQGVILYMGDVIVRIPKLHKGLMSRLLCKLTDSTRAPKIFEWLLKRFGAERTARAV